MEWISKSTEQTEEIGRKFADRLSEGTVVALFGDLGVGKTAFTRGLTQGLKVCDRVTSPTFAIVNEYQGRLPVFHFDMYRLSSADELYDIGWEDYLKRGGVCIIEWSERIQDVLPEDAFYIDIEMIDATTRKISIDQGRNQE